VQGGGETVISANAVDGTKAGHFKRSQSKLSVNSQFSVFCLVVSSHVYIKELHKMFSFSLFLSTQKNTYTHAPIPKIRYLVQYSHTDRLNQLNTYKTKLAAVLCL